MMKSGQTPRSIMTAPVALERQRTLLPRVIPLGDGSVAIESGSRISARQCEVLELLAAGFTNEAIAAELRISGQTVKHHVSGLLDRIGVANRTALAAWWAEVDAILRLDGASMLLERPSTRDGQLERDYAADVA